MTLVVRNEALPSIEKARIILARCRSVKECMHIKALAQAVASIESSEEARNEAAAIVLEAKARAGELTREEKDEKGAGRPSKKSVPRRNGISRTEKLEKQGLSRKDAAEFEKLADLKQSGDLERMIKRSGGALTTAAALTIAKLPPAQRKEVFAKLGEGDVDIKKLVGEVKLDAKRDLAETIRKNPIVTPDGRYQVIAIDPPWKYDTRTEDHTHRGKTDYPEMTVEEICKLPVSKFAQKNCILWLWTTNSFMRDAYRCLDAWDFEEKTILTWDKESIGVGNWLRNVTEHCILAVRGRPTVSLTNQSTIIREKRREHSRKPESFYKLVEKLCPGSKLEMFAREERKGWTIWGAETQKFKRER